MIFEINNKKWQIDDKIIQINIYLQTFLGAQIIWFLAKLYRQILMFFRQNKENKPVCKILKLSDIWLQNEFPPV